MCFHIRKCSKWSKGKGISQISMTSGKYKGLSFWLPMSYVTCISHVTSLGLFPPLHNAGDPVGCVRTTRSQFEGLHRTTEMTTGST